MVQGLFKEVLVGVYALRLLLWTFKVKSRVLFWMGMLPWRGYNTSTNLEESVQSL